MTLYINSICSFFRFLSRAFLLFDWIFPRSRDLIKKLIYQEIFGKNMDKTGIKWYYLYYFILKMTNFMWKMDVFMHKTSIFM